MYQKKPRSNADDAQKFTVVELQDTLECSQQEHESTLRPVLFCTAILGLNDGRMAVCDKRWRIYHGVVLTFILSCCIRRFYQIGTLEPGRERLHWQIAMFDPTVVLTLCNAIFLLCGALAALVLHTLNKKRQEIFNVISPLLAASTVEEVAQRRKIIKWLVAYAILLGLTSGSTAVMYRTSKEHLNLPWVPPVLGDKWYYIFIDFYSIFLAQTAICLLGVFFIQACLIVRGGIRNLLNEMNPPVSVKRLMQQTVPPSRYSPEESLLRIRRAQIHLQQIVDTKAILEKHFSFVLFYSFGCAIPIICFLGYLMLKNINKYWALHFSLGMWIIKILLSLLALSYPAFLITEEGDKLLSAAFKMYNELLCDGTEPLVVTHMSLLIAQIQSSNFTLSASNYFNMNRRILLSLASAIFTYFLILVQFGEGTTLR